MSSYFANVMWQRGQQHFTDNQYSRGHHWHFDGGATVAASASPHIVPLPMSVEANVDPEEAFVAALSSCHMLFFLSIAAKRRYVVDEYTDHAEGIMAHNEHGKMAMTTVTLNPKVSFSGDRTPNPTQIEQLHHLAHQSCFLANSVNTHIIINSVLTDQSAKLIANSDPL